MTNIQENELTSKEDPLMLAVDIVVAYISNNKITAPELPTVIGSVHNAIIELLDNSPSNFPKQEPAVPIKKSITSDYLICLEDGKQLKMLKRYLRSHYNLTPESYRSKWNLPADYPMVAPNYAKQRSKLAKQIGLGQSPTKNRNP